MLTTRSRTRSTTPIPVSSSSRTILLIERDVIAETQIGLAWSDALDMIWSGERRAPLRVVELDLARGTATDLTFEAVKDLASRTVEEGFTPGCLDRFFDDVWKRDERPAPSRNGSVLPCPIRTSPRFAEVQP